MANKRTPTICLYFGTFNPVHMGHLMIAQAALNQFSSLLNIGSLMFIPAGQPPHRLNDADLLQASQRLKLLELATGDHPLFEVNGLELQRTGPSYTVDTLRALQAESKIQTPVPMIIGSDALMHLSSWREPQALAEMVCFLQIPRPGYEVVKQVEIPMPGEFLPNGQAAPMQTVTLNTHCIAMPPLSLSASWIREQVKQSAKNGSDKESYALRYFLPDSVWRYIQDNGLYQ